MDETPRSGHLRRPVGLDLSRIVTSASYLMRERGLSEVSIRAVATQLGVTPMALYNHLADADQLREAVCDKHIGDHLARIPAASSAEAELMAIFLRMHEEARKHPGLLEHHETTDQRIGAGRQALDERAQELLQNLDVDPHLGVEILMSLTSGAARLISTGLFADHLGIVIASLREHALPSVGKTGASRESPRSERRQLT